MAVIEKLTESLRQLYPQGAAFKLFRGTSWRKLNEALLEEPARVSVFFENVRDSGIPGRIPHDGLVDWESLYSLQENAGLSDEERNFRIKSRYDAIGGQGTDYIEDILNDQFQALLTYYRYITRCGEIGNSFCGASTATCGGSIEAPAELVIVENPPVFWNPYLTLGYAIIRSINDTLPLGIEYKYWGSIWLITGPNGPGSFLELPSERWQEFVETVLRLKPVNTWVIAQITLT